MVEGVHGGRVLQTVQPSVTLGEILHQPRVCRTADFCADCHSFESDTRSFGVCHCICHSMFASIWVVDRIMNWIPCDNILHAA